MGLSLGTVKYEVNKVVKTAIKTPLIRTQTPTLSRTADLVL